MRLLTAIPGTVALWQQQGSKADASGNGLTLTLERGVEVYEALGTCLQAATYGPPNVVTNYLCPATGLVQFVGEFTAQFICVPRGTAVQTFLQCETPAGVVLWAFYIDTGVRIAYADQHVNTFLAPAISWTPYAVAGTPILVTFRHRQTSPGNFIVECFIGPTLQAGTLATTTNVAGGTERLRLGGFVSAANLRAAGASWRLLNYSRADVDIAADDASVNDTCLPSPVTLNYRSALATMRTA